MMKTVKLPLDEIYVPVRLRGGVDAAKVEAIAESIAESGQQTPIHVRPDRNRYVLVAGLHRIEALKALGEREVEALIVAARKV